MPALRVAVHAYPKSQSGLRSRGRSGCYVAGMRRKSGQLLALTAVLAALAGCAPMKLRPAPEAQRVPRAPFAAVAESADVHMVVEPESWRGHPDGLDRKLTPIKVTIENRGSRPLRICYEDFIIETGQGTRHTPLPPVDIRGQVTELADHPVYVPRYTVVPRFGHRGFYVVPWYGPYYPGLRPWRTPWPYSRTYYDTYYPRWTVKLPTADMIERAIPEGVIEPGGSVTGFLYFPALEKDLERIAFKAHFSTPSEREPVADLTVPFVVG